MSPAATQAHPPIGGGLQQPARPPAGEESGGTPITLTTTTGGTPIVATTGGHPVVLTPAGGVPLAPYGMAPGAPGAPGAVSQPWQDRMRMLLRTPLYERPAYEPPARVEHTASVPRVLDLALRIGELLLSSGESAEDVEAAMLGVTRAYGLDRCEPNVTFTLLTISYQPSLVDSPVTAERVVRRRGSDYTRLAAVYRLVDDITAEDTTVEEAYGRLAEIRRNRHPYPGWLIALASGTLAGAASVLVGGGWQVFSAAFVAAVLGDRLAWLLARRGLPEFYQFVVAATPAAFTGVLLDLWDVEVRASAVITGGLFALIPGRALVAAVQDGLTGFYITASARLLEVMYLVVGIVCGVGGVLYAGVRWGVQLNADEGFRPANEPVPQLASAMVLTLAFSVMLQAQRRSLLPAMVNGGIGWTVYGTLTYQAGVSPVIATAVAAGLVGLFAQLLSRYRYASALPYVIPAIGPLLPGSATYLGLLSFANGHVDDGWVSLTRAASLALALAVGVNLGGEMARLFLRVPGAGDREQRQAAKRTRGF
nr:threonine/serine exporter family protein [Allostreptomyces psammosilenae]